MNRLPAVLQKEIWEYVRGDRAYFRGQFQSVVDQLNGAVERIEQSTFGPGGGPEQTRTERLTNLVAMFRGIVHFDWDVPRFMKFQHQTHGQLFADNGAEYSQKCREWTPWIDTHKGWISHHQCTTLIH
jgi:hypothetical protein